MFISALSLFSIGVGPSSSHTVGPMRAARNFAHHLAPQLPALARIVVTLYGSLALTGEGHGTPKAVIWGLMGERPDVIDLDVAVSALETLNNTQKLRIMGNKIIDFDPGRHIVMRGDTCLPFHVNGMQFQAFDHNDAILLDETYYSVGGGFIVSEGQAVLTIQKKVPYPFETAKQLLEHAEKLNLPISEVVYQNELCFYTPEEMDAQVNRLWSAMQECIERGLKTEGTLPGRLQVRRRAAALYQQLIGETGRAHSFHDIRSMAYLSAFAMAVNEENAAGGRVVTAPTNGAAGIIPAVLYYHMKFNPEAKPSDVRKFLLTAGAIGLLYKLRASISGAEVGCQGEVGVACSMACAALAEVMGGNIWQVENAAEVGMEHHLGLICDPVDGLVQIPCIERNAMASVRVLNIVMLALMEDGQHKISLDKVIVTMAQVGKDMLSIYRETSLGGLAVNHPEC